MIFSKRFLLIYIFQIFGTRPSSGQMIHIRLHILVILKLLYRNEIIMTLDSVRRKKQQPHEFERGGGLKGQISNHRLSTRH